MRVHSDNWPLCLLCSSEDRRKRCFFSPIGAHNKTHRVTMKCMFGTSARSTSFFPTGSNY